MLLRKERVHVFLLLVIHFYHFFCFRCLFSLRRGVLFSAQIPLILERVSLTTQNPIDILALLTLSRGQSCDPQCRGALLSRVLVRDLGLEEFGVW